ncbi:hypothetical protein ACV1DN_21870 [Aeromonas allosaccharophila]
MHKILLDQAMELTKAQGECWIVLKDGSIKAVNVGDMLPKGVPGRDRTLLMKFEQADRL